MNKKIIVADAGPLIAFGKAKRLNLLTQLGDILAPASVLDECFSNKSLPGAEAISKAEKQGYIKRQNDPDMEEHESLLNMLGLGEATAIILAIQLKASLLIDDKLGRNVATQKGVTIIGTAGILVLAKEQNLIEAVYPLIQELKKAGYYLSDELIKIILKRTGEAK